MIMFLGGQILFSSTNEMAMDVGCCCPTGSGSYGYGREDDELEDEGLGGSGSGSGVVVVPPIEEGGPCCGIPPDTALVATVTAKTGDCVDIPDTVPLPQALGPGSVPIDGVWVSAPLGMGCSGACLFTLECNYSNETPEFSMPTQASCHEATLVSVSCSPLEVVFDLEYGISGIPGGCEGTCRVTITL